MAEIGKAAAEGLRAAGGRTAFVDFSKLSREELAACVTHAQAELDGRADDWPALVAELDADALHALLLAATDEANKRTAAYDAEKAKQEAGKAP